MVCEDVSWSVRLGKPWSKVAELLERSWRSEREFAADKNPKKNFSRHSPQTWHGDCSQWLWFTINVCVIQWTEPSSVQYHHWSGFSPTFLQLMKFMKIIFSWWNSHRLRKNRVHVVMEQSCVKSRLKKNFICPYIKIQHSQCTYVKNHEDLHKFRLVSSSSIRFSKSAVFFWLWIICNGIYDYLSNLCHSFIPEITTEHTVYSLNLEFSWTW